MQELTAILRRAARKLLLARLLENGAVAATAAGLYASPAAVAWALAEPYRSWTILACLLPVVAGGCVMAFPSLQRLLRLSQGERWLVGGIGLAVGVVAGSLVVSGWQQRAGAMRLAPIVLLAGGAAGAAVAVARGASVQEAAILLDVRCDLGERLSTAAELALAGRSDAPLAPVVLGQALWAIKGVPWGLRQFWRRGRATAGAMGLSAVLCLTLAALSSGRSVNPPLQALVQSYETLPAVDRQKLAEDLRRAAKLAQENPALARRLLAAAGAAASDQAVEFKENLTEVEKSILSGVKLPPAAAEILRRAGEQFAHSGPEGQAAADSNALLAGPGAGAALDANRAGQPVFPGGEGGFDKTPAVVRVFDPEYAKVLAGNPQAGAVLPGGSSPDAGKGYVFGNAAWAAAKDKASQAISAGNIPPQYRQLVRDYFLSQ